MGIAGDLIGGALSGAGTSSRAVLWTIERLMAGFLSTSSNTPWIWVF